MPFYLVTIHLRNGEMHKGIRENANMYIEQVWLEYNKLASQHYKPANIAELVVVQISKNSKEFREYKSKLRKPEVPIDVDPGFETRR